VLRALVATWHTRWPDVPAEILDHILATLGTPDAYRTPPARPGTTRHYMPDLRHNRGATGNTDQVIDAFLAVPRHDALRIHWTADLPGEYRETFGKLIELLPYLGRSESICCASLDADEAIPDETWWRLGEAGGDDVRQVELLAPEVIPRREHLEATTVATRKARRLLPLGSRKVSYGVHGQELDVPARVAGRGEPVTCLRLDLSSTVPLRMRSAVIATDALHHAIRKKLEDWFEPNTVAALLGCDPDGRPRRGPHEHVHVLALPEASWVRPFLPASTSVSSLYIWSPEGIQPDVAGAIQREIRKLWPLKHLGWAMPVQYVFPAGHGAVETLLPTLTRESASWVSVTPYLPVRHRKKRQPLEDFLLDNINRETASRGQAAPTTVELIDEAQYRREIAQYRRRRMSEDMGKTKSGVYLRLQLAEPVKGPIILGQLSHFGYGIFMPDDDQPAAE
jgi:CRISPR-associated protein Csb2